MDDLQLVSDWTLNKDNSHNTAIDTSKIYLVGHSRGCGIVILKSAEEKRVKAIATWASVSQCKTPWGSWPQERIKKWKESGVEYYANNRTKQQLPLYYQLYEDYHFNQERLNIINSVEQLTIPLLICHGTEDEAVPVANAYLIYEAARNGELFLLPSDHVFGRKHPWTENHLPEAMQTVVNKTIQFFSALQL